MLALRPLRLRALFLLAALAPAAVAQAQAPIITSIAGVTGSLRGAGGPGAGAHLGRVYGMAVDSAGNIFAIDADNTVAVKIAPDGILTVVAGNAIRGFSGEGGPATSASISPQESSRNNLYPGIAVDSRGNIYFSDTHNGRIRRVSSEGIITTVATSGSPAGVAVDAVGNVYFTDYFGNRVNRLSSSGIITRVAGTGAEGSGGDGGPAINARLRDPEGLAVDAAGNLYIADAGNGRVRRVSASGIITTVAGGGFSDPGDGGPATAADLQRPSGLALDSAGNLYIADTWAGRIRRVSPAGIITTVAGTGVDGFSGDGGPAVAARLNDPTAVGVDRSGNIYISDTENWRIRKVNPGGIITTIGGNGSFRFFGDGGPATSAEVSRPNDVAVDQNGNVYIADRENFRIRKISAQGIITTLAGNGQGGFSGDGGPATSAAIGHPQALTVDRLGNVYFSTGDVFTAGGESRVRVVTPNGIIRTVAGTSDRGFSGDGGPATSARLDWPRGLAVDAAGNLYFADRFNLRVRKVTPAGIISTVAGSGDLSNRGFSGDGGPATAAKLDLPTDVAVDTAGNLYIADSFNDRIRVVNPAGIISTFAGNGTSGGGGDGGLARNASISRPEGVAVDSAGNVYVAEQGLSRIRKINPSGIISTFAGNTVDGYSGDGGLATAASLNEPSGLAVDTAGNVYIADTENDRVRKTLLAAPSFQVQPATVSLSAPAGAPATSAPALTVRSDVFGLGWTAQAATQSGGNWLSVSPAAGTTPGTINLGADVANLSPGAYRGTITVQAPLAAPSTLTTAVELSVTPGLAPQLLAEPGSLTLETATGASGAVTRGLRIGNGGGGTLTWNTRSTTVSGGNWLTVSPASGTATGAAPASAQISASPAGLAAGTYSGSVQVESPTTGEAKTVAVTLLVQQVTQTILVSQSGLLFTGVEGAGAVASQTFGIVNAGQGVMGWTARAETLSGGSWLSVSPASGRSDAASLQVPLVEMGINLGSLRAGQYSALIRVEAPGASNSPQFVTVELNVLPPGSNPGLLVRPTGLIFAAHAGTSSPGSQNLRLTSAAPGSVEARSGVLTFDGGTWLQTLPRNLVVSPSQPQTMAVQPALGSLAAGVYRAAMTLLFADGSPPQAVNILFLVVRSTAAVSDPATGAEAARLGAEQCAPQRLHAVHRTLASNFASSVSWPSQIEVQVLDDCGNAVNNATVVASFSSGDPPMVLASLRNGLYTGTWRPANPAAQITATVRASLAPLAPVELAVQGQVRDNPSAPALASGGIVNGASFAAGSLVAPGSIVSVFGRNLAAGLNHATSLPLEKTLGGATLMIGGIEVPLFFSSQGQINAQLPFELPPNSRPQAIVRVRREGAAIETLTVPETITLAAARPGIFTTNQQGTGQGAILDASGRLVDGNAPAAAGQIVQVFCTGLGATQPPVPSGQPAPGNPPATVVVPVEARVGGRPAVVHFAGLAPGFVGLYQVNVEIPAGIEANSAAPLTLLQDGVPGNTVTLAIR